MSRIAIHLLIALALLGTGETLRRLAAIEEALADSRERLVTRISSVAPDSYDALAGQVGPLARVPLLGARIRRDISEQRALAAYWNGQYDAVLREATEDERAVAPPMLQWIAANARYRLAIRTGTDRTTTLRTLDESLQAYRLLLERVPGHAAAAYNYEFVSRLRTALARSPQAQPPDGDGPPNMHGEEGQPPEGTRPPDFNVIVPLRPDERDEQFDAGRGGVTRRRG